VVIKISGTTIAQRIAPGQTDLSKAEAFSVTEVGTGDRVLVTLTPDGSEARRIVVIAATDIAKRDAADRADWQRRGVAGVVTAVSGGEVTIEARSLAGATKYIVTTGPKTTFKRYAADSVRYDDAKDSNAAEIRAGDQLRARGAKSADGTKVDAEAVVFGTFLSRAGAITAINAPAKELTVKDLATNKPVVISFATDSKVRRMPAAAAMTAMMGGGRGAGRPPDIAQVLELLPPIPFDDLKVGEIAVLSGIQGTKADRITAITFLANAETLVQMAMAARGNTGPAPSLAGLAGSISNVGSQ
jgi:hypothetical protein